MEKDKFRFPTVIVKIAQELNYTIEEIMDKPSDWISLVYKEIIDDETKKYKIMASFFGVDISGKNKSSKLMNRQPLSKELKSMGFGHKKGK